MTINELEQRLSALQVEKDKLTAELERLKSEEEHKGVKPWRAKGDCLYYYVDTDNSTSAMVEDTHIKDTARFKCGNYYRTKALAEQDAKELALRGRVRQLRDALCEGYQFVNNVSNWLIYFDTEDEKFYADERILCNYVGVICFDTYEHAQQACDILNKELKNGNIKI